MYHKKSNENLDQPKHNCCPLVRPHRIKAEAENVWEVKAASKVVEADNKVKHLENLERLWNHKVFYFDLLSVVIFTNYFEVAYEVSLFHFILSCLKKPQINDEFCAHFLPKQFNSNFFFHRRHVIELFLFY